MQECRAGQERKDRAEIDALRTEVSVCGLCHEYSTSRWSGFPGRGASE